MAYQPQSSSDCILICEGAYVVGDVKLNEGVSVWYNAVLRGDEGGIVVGKNTNVQDGVIIHEKVSIGQGCTIGHGAVVHGCTIGDNVLIGMGTILLNGARIGDNCLVGAGSLVTGKMDAPAGSMILGNPAKVVRLLTEAEIESNRASAQTYIRLTEAYKRGGTAPGHQQGDSPPAPPPTFS